MDRVLDYQAAKAALEWQLELGATEAIGETPLNRYELPEAPPVTARKPAVPSGTPSATRSDGHTVAQPAENIAAPSSAMPAAILPAAPDAVAQACRMAAAASDLAALREAVAAFDLCELKKGARNTVFADGNPEARVMVIGEAPGRDEDIEGRPFVGRAGKLLDKMFAAIGLSRAGHEATALYITNIMPWRPPQNRDPTPDEIAMMLPFIARHMALAAPDLVVLMGNTACAGMLGQRGITRLRGTWVEVHGLPAMPMFHPAYLLRTPSAKREAWADLLAIRARLGGGGA